MANFNRVILAGNMVTDPKMKYLEHSQTPVTEFRMAVNRKYKTSSGEMREEAMFIDCSAFGVAAETINRWCKKGKPILVEGRLKYDTWEDREGGGKRSKHSVVIENFQFIGPREGGGGDGSADGGGGGEYEQRPSRPPMARAGAPRQAPRPAPAAEPPFSDEPQFKDDDIPF